MENIIFSELWSDALRSEGKDVYLSEWSTSTAFPANAYLPDVVQYLSRIWDGAHMSMRKICKAAGLSQKAMSVRYGIPYTTMSDWCRDVAKPADYIRLLLLESLGLLEREFTGSTVVTKYEIHRSRMDCAKAYKGVTMDTNDHEYDVLESYDSMADAEAALGSYRSSYRKLGDGLWRAEEIYIVEREYNEDGEDMGRYDIWAWAAE